MRIVQKKTMYCKFILIFLRIILIKVELIYFKIRILVTDIIAEIYF
jgi:hypothetical protein